MTRFLLRSMGTVTSVFANGMITESVRDAVREVFDAVDSRFSLYCGASELARVASGALALQQASSELREAYAEALAWSFSTLGAFTPHRPDGVIDLSGLVKAYAIREAGAVLDRAGLGQWSVGCGGDVLERRPASQSSRAGIADPDHPGELLTVLTVSGSRRAVATSGIAERGEHVWGRSEEFAQVTVVADGIVEADVFATAILAGGAAVLDHVSSSHDVDVFTVDRRGELLATPGIVDAVPA